VSEALLIPFSSVIAVRVASLRRFPFLVHRPGMDTDDPAEYFNYQQFHPQEQHPADGDAVQLECSTPQVSCDMMLREATRLLAAYSVLT